ncbi:RNA polymerase sigma-70 factor [Flavobacteriaceae bacterium 3-367]
MDDIEVAKALKRDDKTVFKWLFDRYYQRLVAYIMSYTHNLARSEDIVQQAYVDLWENRRRLYVDRSPKNYLYAIAYNGYVDSVKNRKRTDRLLEELWERTLRDRITEDRESHEKRMAKLRALLDALPPKCREVVRLNKLEGVGYREIAERLGISIKTVEYHMGAAYRKIREAFDEKSKG